MPSSSEVFAHIEAIKQGIENSRNLRDQSLFALLKTGLQSQVILGARVSQVVSLDAYMASSAGTIIDVIKAKSSLPLESAAVIERYISAAKLSADDYLFPSADRTQPMSTAQLSRIFRSWEKQAGFPLSKLTPHSLRKASNVSRSTLGHGYEQIADQLGHSSAAMVEKYVQLAATGADAILKAKKRT